MALHAVEVPSLTIGLDVSDRNTSVCMLDAAGDVIEERRVRTSREALRRLFEDLDPARVALEVGPHSPWMSRVIKRWGHDVLVANARQVKLIYGSDRKTDRVDAESLARLARLDPTLLRPIVHRGEQTQKDLATLRARGTLVEARTQMVNHVRGSVKALGERIPRCSTESFPKKARPHLPPGLEPALEPILDSIAHLTRKIRAYDRESEILAAERYPVTERLRQINGVGPLTALTFVLVIEDPHRFRRSRSVGPYLGLCRKQNDSGESQPRLRITRAGDEVLRTLLVQAAHYILGPFGTDCDLRRRGLELVQTRGKKKAAIAVARKLSVLLHRLWVSGDTYDPFYNSRPQTVR